MHGLEPGAKGAGFAIGPEVFAWAEECATKKRSHGGALT
jgi:hypothetical protein